KPGDRGQHAGSQGLSEPHLFALSHSRDVEGVRSRRPGRSDDIADQVHWHARSCRNACRRIPSRQSERSDDRRNAAGHVHGQGVGAPLPLTTWFAGGADRFNGLRNVDCLCRCLQQTLRRPLESIGTVSFDFDCPELPDRPIPAAPGRKARHDCEYERNGVASLFMMFAPLEGWRSVKVADRHAASDYAHVLKELSDTHFPEATKIVLVQDNLSTHAPASLYATFPAAEARRLVERFEWHYTPKHGSWLDMAESELAVLATQCLDRRIPDKPTLIAEVAAWQRNRNKSHVKAEWQFTTKDARIKLKTLYPQFE